jgi:hypothetical protein
MQDILIRIETEDFAAWEAQHYAHAGDRARYGIQDGPAYRDIEDPNAALFHIRVEDMDRAMAWFRSDTFKEATKLAKVKGRTFYLAQPRS